MAFSRGESRAEMSGLRARLERSGREERWINFIIKFIHLRPSYSSVEMLNIKLYKSEELGTSSSYSWESEGKCGKSRRIWLACGQGRASVCLRLWKCGNIKIENRSIYALNLRDLGALILLLVTLQLLHVVAELRQPLLALQNWRAQANCLHGCAEEALQFDSIAFSEGEDALHDLYRMDLTCL